MDVNGEWFNTWFDSDYYPLLYRHRDSKEAKEFISVLNKHLHFKPGQQALDAACGRGRHARHLAESGLEVTGIDISEKSIAYAKQFETDKLHFLIQDIRKPIKEKAFDYIFNLFTSFGYFEADDDNIATLKAFSSQLNTGGVLVLDYLNPINTLKNLVAEEVKVEAGIQFLIRRKVKGNFLWKEISFEDQNKKFLFCEKVRLISQEEFLNYFNFAGLSIKNIFGSYLLEDFHEENSTRMIFVAQKK